jgi:hypothetical protein
VLSGIGGSWQRAPHAPLASLGALATSNPVTSVDVQTTVIRTNNRILLGVLLQTGRPLSSKQKYLKFDFSDPGFPIGKCLWETSCKIQEKESGKIKNKTDFGIFETEGTVYFEG